jgi:hypothetical protein
MADPITTPWTLRFTEWACGHHQQRPDDIPVSSPEQAQLILQAIGNAISQPGHARACVFNDTQGIDDIYVTDDHCDFNPAKRVAYDRPVLVLCADEATANAMLADELEAAREDLWAVADLTDAKVWDGKEMLSGYDVALTTLTREQIDAIIEQDRDLLPEEAHRAHFGLPPLFRDGAEVLAALRKEAESIAAYEAECAADEKRAYEAGQAADLKREEMRLDAFGSKS